MAPFTEVALILETAGRSQSLDASSEHFVADRHLDRLAPHGRIANHHGHFLPSRLHDGEDDPVDLGHRYRRRKLYLIPTERAADFGKFFERDETWKAIIGRLQQFGIELDDKPLERGGILILIFKNLCCCPRFVEFECGREQVVKNSFRPVPGS